MKNIRVVLLLFLMLMVLRTAQTLAEETRPDAQKVKAGAATAPAGCFFVDRRSAVEACAGDLHVSFSKTRGGVYTILPGHGNKKETLGTIGARIEVTRRETAAPTAARTKIVLRQENDGGPEFFYLEEGNLRCGLRVMFQLLDADGTYYGDGLQEVWLYPSGDLYAALYARVQDRRSYQKIHGGWLDLTVSDAFSKVSAGTPDRTVYDQDALQTRHQAATKNALQTSAHGQRTLQRNTRKDVAIPFGQQSLPDKYVAFQSKERALLFYWLQDRGRYASSFSAAYDKLPGPPTYRKWPHAIDQYVPRLGFTVSKTARLVLARQGAQSGARFIFEDEPKGVANPVNYSIGAIYALSVGESVPELTARAALYRDVIDKKSIRVDGGEFAFFNDMENGYEVFKAKNPVSVTFPADARERLVTLTVFGLKEHGGVAARVDGEKVPVQLASDGGLPDDPLAPIKEPPHAPAQQATLSFRLQKDAPTTAVVKEVPGVQITYQRRHPLRAVAIFSSHNSAKRAGLEFCLLDGIARHISGWGRPDYAVTENALYWFRNCSYSRHEYADNLRDFVVEESGPEKVVFRYRSATFNDRVHSQYTITVPYEAPCFMFTVQARFEVSQYWASDKNQFFDMFPFRGVYPSDWWWKEVLSMNKAGEWGIRQTLGQGRPGPPPPKMTNTSFYGFYAAERGNVLLFAKNFAPPDAELSTALCGNYIDLHLDFHLKTDPDLGEAIPGSVYSMEYDFAVYGDDSLSRAQVAEIGKASLQANRLVIPASE